MSHPNRKEIKKKKKKTSDKNSAEGYVAPGEDHVSNDM